MVFTTDGRPLVHGPDSNGRTVGFETIFNERALPFDYYITVDEMCKKEWHAMRTTMTTGGDGGGRGHVMTYIFNHLFTAKTHHLETYV